MSAALTVLSGARTAVGVGGWVAPGTAWRTFGLGALPEALPSAAVMSRLFAVRDLAFGLGLRHPEPAVRRAVLQAGIAIDAVDVVASVVGVRRGAPRASLLGVTAGAAFFVVLGAVALGEE
ncbi:MAG: hypothetical protein JWN84_3498 [Nocardioides sp.]|nr:hypothetical protein [Nocardioides sp.]